MGMFLGGFLGDALGAPYEFKISRPLSDYRGLLEYETKVPRQYHEPLVYPVGAITDDSQMTIHLMRSIVKTGGYDRNDVILSYLDFANSTSQLGKNTRLILKGIKTLRGYESRKGKIDPNNESNGPLMRASPLSIFNDSNIWISDVSITNTSQTNYIVNIIYLYAIRYALLGKSKEEIRDLVTSLANQYQNYNIITAVNEAINGIKRNVDVRTNKRSNKGWVVHAFYAAIYALLHFNDYKTAIDEIILLGGDTDTNAKIAGDLLGAYYGYAKIYVNDVMRYNLQILFANNQNYLYDFMSNVTILSKLFQI